MYFSPKYSYVCNYANVESKSIEFVKTREFMKIKFILIVCGHLQKINACMFSTRISQRKTKAIHAPPL